LGFSCCEVLESDVNVQYQPNPRNDSGVNHGKGRRNHRELMRPYKLTDPPRRRAQRKHPQGSKQPHFGGQKIARVVDAYSSQIGRHRNRHGCSQWRSDSIARLQPVASLSHSPSHGHSHILHHNVPQQTKHCWQRDHSYHLRPRYNRHFHPVVRDLQHCIPCILC